jgi:hypothetical protein
MLYPGVIVPETTGKPKNTTHWFAAMDRNDDSLGGFQELCK